MASTPIWFDQDSYLQSKLVQLRTLDINTYGSWSVPDVVNAITDAGMTPFQHFQDHGQYEGASPNSLFDSEEYLANKTAQMQIVDPGGGWTLITVSQAIEDADMSLWEHFQKHGYAEGVNPSRHFDVMRYLQDKSEQLGDGYSTEDVIDAMQEAGIDAVSHYLEYGVSEGLNAFDDYGRVITPPEISNHDRHQDQEQDQVLRAM